MTSLTTVLNDLRNKNYPKNDIDIVHIIGNQLGLPLGIVKKGIIKQGLLKINNQKVLETDVNITENCSVKFGERIITIKTNKLNLEPNIDQLIEYLLESFDIRDFYSISPENRNKICSYLIEYCSYNHNSNEELAASSLHTEIFEIFESFYRENLKDARDNKIPKRKELLDILIRSRNDCYQSLKNLTQNLKDDIFTEQLYRFLQEYSKIITNNGFQYCISPINNSSIYSRPSLEALIKPVHDAKQIIDLDDKYRHYEHALTYFNNYFSLLDETNPLHEIIFRPISQKLLQILKDRCEVAEIKSAEIHLEAHQRKYNFANTQREHHELLLVIKNIGEGLARDIKLYNEDSNFNFEKVSVGILRPNENRNITITARIADSGFQPSLASCCSWIDMANEIIESKKLIKFEQQDNNVPWDLLIKNKPYTIQEIEDRDKLYGRDEILEELKNNIFSKNIESYKIWGQKRVGKSSIVKTLKSLFNNEEDIIVVWRSIAGLKNTDPINTLNTLGESLCSEIFEEIEKKTTNTLLREKLTNIQVPEFNGSLFPLETYIRKLKSTHNPLKFVFILDEFDRINEEFFLPGDIGNTLSLNIGKGLNEKSFIGFILVGSENMHLLDRQGINYNSYQEREIDTFDKAKEYDSFKNIIVGPVDPYLTYSNESIDLIFNYTNGNPYFANLVCSHIFKTASNNRDSEIDVYVTRNAINNIVNSSQKSHYEHFWGDGITEESNIKKEKKTDIRRRILVSFSFAYFKSKTFPTRTEIIRNFNKPIEYQVENFEIENTIKEFFNRKIFYEDNTGKIRIKPSIFEQWLCGSGRTLMIEGISDLEALQKEKELEYEYSLKENEILRVCESYPFKGNTLKRLEVLKFFEQFGDATPQRRVFKLIDSLCYISKSELNDFFRKEQKNIFKDHHIELKMGARTIYREGVEIFSFPKYIDENEDIIESFKVLSHIRSTKSIKNTKNFREFSKSNDVSDIIIFHSLLTNYSEITENMSFILKENNNPNKTPIKLVCLIITSKAKADLIRATSSVSYFKLIFYKEIQETKIKPFIESTEVFETKDESNSAFWEIRKHFPEIGNDVTNVVFETHCPDQSLPILWCKTEHFSPLFPNPHGDINKYNQKRGEKNRDRVYHANKEIEQRLHKYITNYLKEKAQKQNDIDWLTVKYIPKSVVTEITTRHIEENQTEPLETYFDFRHYGLIIKNDSGLASRFSLPGDGLKWCDELNRLRRDPAHPTKPAPTDEEVIYIERIRTQLLNII